MFTSHTSPFGLCFHFSLSHNGLLYKTTRNLPRVTTQRCRHWQREMANANANANAAMRCTKLVGLVLGRGSKSPWQFFPPAVVDKILSLRKSIQGKFCLRRVPTTPDPNTSAKVSRYKWEAYRDTNWWCIYYFLPRGGHTFAKVWEVYRDTFQKYRGQGSIRLS